MAGYMPSILCYERCGPDAWREHFCLVNPAVGMEDDPEAASAIAHKHLDLILIPTLLAGPRA